MSLEHYGGKCPLPQLFQPLRKPKKAYTEDELTELTKRWRTLYGSIRNVAYAAEPGQQAVMLKKLDYAAKQAEWMLEVANVNNLKPQNGHRWAAFKARNFAIEYDDFMQTTLSVPGEIRQKIRRMERLVETEVADNLAKIETMHKINGAQRQARFILRDLPKPKQDELWTMAIEEGQIPRLAHASQYSPVAMRRMNQKYQKFVEHAKQAGLQQHQIDDLVASAVPIGAAYDEALALAKGSGIPMGEVSGIGYFRRKFTPDVADIIAKKKKLAGDLDNPKALYQSFQKSRHTFEFVVEDEHLLAFALGKPLDSMTAIVNDPKLLMKTLHEIPEEKLDNLVKMGVVGKIPLTTSELVDDLIKRYELPVKGLSEMFLTDQVEAYKAYTNSLKDMVSNSTIVQGIMKEGMDSGWAVTDVIKSTSPEYKDFVPINGDVLARFINPGRLNQLKKGGDVFVHPLVKDMLLSTLDLATKPGATGMLAELIHHTKFISKNSKALMLTAPRYVANNAMGGAIAMWAAGGNLISALPNYLQYIKLHNVGESVLDNTKKLYGGGQFTEKELYKQLLRSGALNEVIPQAAMDAAKGGPSAWNPKNAEAALRYTFYTFQKFGFGDGVNKVEDLVSHLVSEPAMFLGMMANLTDNAYKWNVYKTILSDSLVQTAGGFLTTGQVRRFTNISDAQKHVERYLFDYSNRGKVDEFLSSGVFPFWMYMSRNLPSQLRHMLDSPHQYMAYQRIHALINDPASQEGDDLPAGGISKWTNDAFPLLFRGHGDDFFAIHTTAFDPIADGFMQVSDIVRDVQYRVTGKYVGNDEQKRRQAKGVYTSDFLERYTKALFPLYKSVVATGAWLTGAEKDYFTGRHLQSNPQYPTSFIGIEMPPLARLYLEQNVPILQLINSMNPWYVFGAKERKNEKGEVIRQARPSVFGASRSDADSKDPLLRTLAPLGAGSVNKIDPTTRAMNMGYTEKDMKALQRELRQRVKWIEQNYEKQPTNRKPQLQQQMKNAQNILWALGVDLARIKDWKRRKGVQSKDMSDIVREEGVTISKMPDGRTSTRVQNSLRRRFDMFDAIVALEKEEAKRRGQ
jgi:hypothetical protein